MTMRYKIIVGNKLTEDQKQNVASIIKTTFYEINTVFNKWNPDSELSKLNNLKSGTQTPISSSLERLFKEADVVVKLSEGRFDPTIEPLQRLWKEKLYLGITPDNNEISAITPAIGWGNIHFQNGIFYKDNDLTELDFGGIAKGLGIDLLIERFNQSGYGDVFVEWGGEIRATGKHPEGRPWTIYISCLYDNDPSKAIATIYLENQSIATSGDYLQNWSIRVPSITEKATTRTYFHIFDPHTFQALETTFSSIAGTSVIAHNCALADGLATAAMLFSSSTEAEAWAKKIKQLYPYVEFWIISRSSILNKDVYSKASFSL